MTSVYVDGDGTKYVAPLVVELCAVRALECVDEGVDVVEFDAVPWRCPFEGVVAVLRKKETQLGWKCSTARPTSPTTNTTKSNHTAICSPIGAGRRRSSSSWACS